LEKRVRFESKTIRMLIKKISCTGIRILCKGRLNFRDRAKKSQIAFGSIPLQTIKANIDYSCIIANTAKGLQSIKVWIHQK
jgi:small subunit ribosomal protein S3